MQSVGKREGDREAREKIETFLRRFELKALDKIYYEKKAVFALVHLKPGMRTSPMEVRC